MERADFEMQLIEEQVAKAWEEEKMLVKILLDRDVDKNEPLCQGLANNIERRLCPIFKCNKFYISVNQNGGKNNRGHVCLLVIGVENYIVDGTIKQFLPDEKRTVFKVDDYPLGKEFGGFEGLQTW